ncbi:MAG: transglycosylase SLT domain-containing protein [Bacteroidales bacterium]|nr:transglycosylase SLT domain-containing protein [Candidatus Cryptobacteroides caccocaballi]
MKPVVFLRHALCTLLMLPICHPCSRNMDDMENDGHSYKGEHIRCAIALGSSLQESLKYGLNYEILQDFAEAEGCDIEIVMINDSTDYADSLRKGVFDIVALRTGRDSLDFEGIDFSWSYDGVHALAVAEDRYTALGEINMRLFEIVSSGKYDEMEKMFKVGYDPFKRAESGITSKHLSPYDAIIKRYAKELGWDWRMLAALIYKESKFTINNVSLRGAVGLMQVRPSTAAAYGIQNLLDPEQNIKAGTANIKAIQDKYFASEEFTIDEKEKFTLAAYNAGVGRIADCRRLAASMGKSSYVWDEVKSVIPYMSDTELLDTTDVIQYGHFSGVETIAYIDDVKNVYDAFCTICPTSR